MPISAQISGTNVIVTATWTKPIEVSQRAANDAAAWFFDNGGNHGEDPRTFEDLSNQEKLDIIYTHWTQVVVDAALAYRVNADMDAARSAVEPYEF